VEGKYEHTDANVIWNAEVQGLALENDRGTGRKGSDGKMIRSYDIEILDKGDYSSLLLERLIEENVRNGEICKLWSCYVNIKKALLKDPGNAKFLI
jgi:hypothetical protein